MLFNVSFLYHINISCVHALIQNLNFLSFHPSNHFESLSMKLGWMQGIKAFENELSLTSDSLLLIKVPLRSCLSLNPFYKYYDQCKEDWAVACLGYGGGIKPSKVAWLREGVIPTALFRFLRGESSMECRSGEDSRLEKHVEVRTHDLLTTKTLIAF